MKRITDWHKLFIGRWQNILRIDNYQTLWVSFVKGLLLGYIICSLVSCTVTYEYANTPIYEDREHSTELYFWTDNELGGSPYWGYYTGFYYYYGTPHYYPWWYYYQAIPPHHHHTHTHVYVNCDNGYYVYGHRGNMFNNTNGGNYIATTKPRTNRTKTNVFPYTWKSSNSSINVKQNDNRIYVKPNTQHNTTPVIIKNNNTNTNRSNVNTNRSNTKPNKNQNNTRINNKVTKTNKINKKPR
tara:strand:- start:105 stop:827 length:723 start_codon:yes stop_codon:yes gene_type:complete